MARAAHHGRGSHKLRIVTDTTPPETVLTAGPTEGAFLTESSTSFAFTGTDNVGISGYECSLDGGSFSACISPKGYSSLTAESHTFRVRAKDRGGNLDPTPATRTFTVSLPSSSVSVPASPVSVPSSPVSVPSSSVLFFDDFSQANGPNNLITNEYASYNPNQAGVVKSPNWENRRGSMFFRNGMAWSGVPDGNWADKYSSTSNDSAWTNLRTHRSDFGNVKAEYDFMIPYLTSTSSSPAVSWDGSQMWLRYQTEQHLYTISFFDRSGKTYIKKKCPGGQQNGGTYYMLAGVQNTIPFGQWQHVAGIVQNNPGGTVTIKGYQNGKLLIQATDDHIGCPSITSAGRVGLRANNAEWYMDNFRVSGL